MDGQEPLPRHIQVGMEIREHDAMLTLELQHQAQGWGVALTEKQYQDLEQQDIEPLELFRQAPRNEKYDLTYKLFQMLKRAELEYLLEEVPSNLEYKLLTYRPTSSIELNPENDDEERAWFHVLNEGLQIAKRKFPGTDPKFN